MPISAKIELKSQLYSVGHCVMKSTEADFRVMENGMTNFLKQKLNLKFRKRHVDGCGKKTHLNFRISITVNTGADERKKSS